MTVSDGFGRLQFHANDVRMRSAGNQVHRMIHSTYHGLVNRLVLAVVLVATCGHVDAHDPNATITWNREISRIVYDRCASCHREGGTSFSLMTYKQVQPRAAAVKDAVLSRRMPPWGAVKGFGSFRNDEGLSQEQISLITYRHPFLFRKTLEMPAGTAIRGVPRGARIVLLPPQPK